MYENMSLYSEKEYVPDTSGYPEMQAIDNDYR